MFNVANGGNQQKPRWRASDMEPAPSNDTHALVRLELELELADSLAKSQHFLGPRIVMIVIGSYDDNNNSYNNGQSGGKSEPKKRKTSGWQK